jgi:hypothetical protein
MTTLHTPVLALLWTLKLAAILFMSGLFFAIFWVAVEFEEPAHPFIMYACVHPLFSYHEAQAFWLMMVDYGPSFSRPSPSCCLSLLLKLFCSFAIAHSSQYPDSYGFSL